MEKNEKIRKSDDEKSDDGSQQQESEVKEFSFYNEAERVRQLVKKFMHTNVLGHLYTTIVMGLSVLLAFEYVYYSYKKQTDDREFVILTDIEASAAILFGFDWFLGLFLADHYQEYIFSFFSIVDIFTVVPIWVTYNVQPVQYSEIRNSFDRVIYLAYLLHTTRILRMLKIYKRFDLWEDKVKKALAIMILSILTLLVYNAAVMQYLEREVQPLPWHVWLYFAWIETTTVGYGDITAKSDLGRFAVMFFIACSLVILPSLTNELLELMSQYSIYQRIVYVPKPGSKHVIICGDMSSTALLEFFSELFHEDHNVGNMIAIILQPESPSVQMRGILTNQEFFLNVMYVEGSPLSNADLVRCSADTAQAIFVLTNKFTSNPDMEDTMTILSQFNIRRYCQVANPFAQPFFCLQLIRPENQRHLETQSGVSVFSDEDNDSNIIVCLNQIKMGVIAKSCTFPGTNTLIMNLLTSFADDDEEDEEDDDDDAGDDVGNWLDEYYRGWDWEIYSTDLAEAFEGQLFSDLALKIYSLYNVLLFGLEVRDKSGKCANRILLNPKKYYIPSMDEYELKGIVMARNAAAGDLSFANSEDGGTDAKNTLMLRQFQMNSTTPAAEDGSHMRCEVGSEHSAPRQAGSVSPETAKVQQALSWQKLLRNSDREKLNANESEQERMQKAEELFLRFNFHMRDKPASLADCTVKNSISGDISGHLIIMGKSLSNLYDLIRPLRAKNLGPAQVIVILYPENISHALWQRISIFEGIFVIRGSPLEENDLKRAGIFRASRVIALASVDDKAKNHDLGSLVDADAIFSYQAVRRLNEKAVCVVEIIKQSSIAYLGSDDDESSGSGGVGDGYRLTPQFASGVLFTSSMLDTLVVQAFYNPIIIKILQKLIGNVDNEATGDLLTGTKPKGLAAVRSSGLYQISIPDGLESRTYGALFRYLANTGMIPIGLYRGVFSQMKGGSKNNKMPYVFTNPSKDTELFSCDKVFVLSPEPPMKVIKEVKDIHLLENAIKQRALTTAEINANALRDDFYKLVDNQRDIHSKVEKTKTLVLEQVNFALKHLENLLGDYERKEAEDAEKQKFNTLNSPPARRNFNPNSMREDISAVRGRLNSVDEPEYGRGRTRTESNAVESMNRPRTESMSSVSGRGRNRTDSMNLDNPRRGEGSFVGSRARTDSEIMGHRPRTDSMGGIGRSRLSSTTTPSGGERDSSFFSP